MTEALFILAIVVITALAFDFTNGFHDTANAMATSIATGALKPKTAVVLAAGFGLVHGLAFAAVISGPLEHGAGHPRLQPRHRGGAARRRAGHPAAAGLGPASLLIGIRETLP